jgi:hypothetical protein
MIGFITSSFCSFSGASIEGVTAGAEEGFLKQGL